MILRSAQYDPFTAAPCSSMSTTLLDEVIDQCKGPHHANKIPKPLSMASYAEFVEVLGQPAAAERLVQPRPQYTREWTAPFDPKRPSASRERFCILRSPHQLEEKCGSVQFATTSDVRSLRSCCRHVRRFQPIPLAMVQEHQRWPHHRPSPRQRPNTDGSWRNTRVHVKLMRRTPVQQPSLRLSLEFGSPGSCGVRGLLLWPNQIASSAQPCHDETQRLPTPMP